MKGIPGRGSKKHGHGDSGKRASEQCHMKQKSEGGKNAERAGDTDGERSMGQQNGRALSSGFYFQALDFR